MNQRLFIGLFLLISIAMLFALTINHQELIRLTQPTLMPLLLYFIYKSSKGKVSLPILLLSLGVLLSWGRDVTLLYQGKVYFLIGISFLLLAQAVYSIALFRSTYQTPGLDFKKVSPFIIYFLLVVIFTFYAKSFYLLIILQGVVGAVLTGVAMLREGNISQKSYLFGLFGSLSFLLSGSILIIDLAYHDIPFSELWILGAYLAGQLLMALAILYEAHMDIH